MEKSLCQWEGIFDDCYGSFETKLDYIQELITLNLIMATVVLKKKNIRIIIITILLLGLTLTVLKYTAPTSNLSSFTTSYVASKSKDTTTTTTTTTKLETA